MNLTYIHIRVLPETFSVLVQRQPEGGGGGEEMVVIVSSYVLHLSI